jgi:hypothetical protein
MTFTYSPSLLESPTVEKLADSTLVGVWTNFCSERNKRDVESYVSRSDCIRAIKNFGCETAMEQWGEWAHYVATYRITG